MDNHPAERAMVREFFVINYPPGTATARYLQSVIDRMDAVDHNAEAFQPYNEEARIVKREAIISYMEMLDAALRFEAEHGTKLCMKDIAASAMDKTEYIKRIRESLLDAGVNFGMAKQITELIVDGLIDGVRLDF